MPSRSRTLGALLDEVAAARPDAEALVFAGQRLTYAAWRDRVDTLARALLALGVRRGDRVSLLLPNRPEWLITAFAASKLGAVTVAISTFSAPREIAWTLEHAQPRALVAMEAFRGRGFLTPLHDLCPELAGAAPGALRAERLPELRAVLSIDKRRHDGVLRWSDVMARAPEVGATALGDASPQGIAGRRGVHLLGGDRRHLVGVGQGVVHERAREELPGLVVDDALEKRLTQALGQAPVELPLGEEGVHDRPGVVHLDQPLDAEAPRLPLDGHRA